MYYTATKKCLVQKVVKTVDICFFWENLPVIATFVDSTNLERVNSKLHTLKVRSLAQPPTPCFLFFGKIEQLNSVYLCIDAVLSAAVCFTKYVNSIQYQPRLKVYLALFRLAIRKYVVVKVQKTLFVAHTPFFLARMARGGHTGVFALEII